MEMTLIDVLSYIKNLTAKISEPIIILGKQYTVSGFLPKIAGDGTQFRKHHYSMSDLFGLEPPRTFADAKRYQETYGVDISLTLEEVYPISGYCNVCAKITVIHEYVDKYVCFSCDTVYAERRGCSG